MKMLFASALVAISACGVAHAEPAANGEIGYPNGSIGYDALMAGDNDRAISQIMASDSVSRNDPAKLINLGQAYARTGRTAQAAQLFTAAMQSRNEVDLILADGTVMNSREAAGLALAKLRTRVASR
jgi:Flp pilus assembly protein TadD